MEFSLWSLFYFGFIFFLILSNFIFLSLRKRGFYIPNFKKFIIIIDLTNIFIIIFYFVLQKIITFELPMFILYTSLILIYSIFSFVILIFSSFYPVETKIIDLPIPSRMDSKKGDIKIGRLVRKRRKKYHFYLSLKDLERHMFICGFTGTGKSNFVYNFLINFKKKYKIPFFLVEFKGEYKFLHKNLKEILLLSPGENFSINIFNPEFTKPFIHAERIFEILKSSQFLESNAEYTPQMEKVLVDLIISVCSNKETRNWRGFDKFCEEYLLKNENQIPQLKQTIISIKNRIRRFSEGPLKKVFVSDSSISVSEILKKNCILDLSSIIRLGGDKEDLFFFFNVILKYLWDYNLESGVYQGIKHIMIVEDAQYFIPKSLVKKNKLSTYLEDIALLQRGTGECLICIATRPDISEEVLANSGVVISFKNHYEKEILGELMSLPRDHYEYLSILDEGQCIVRVNSIKIPFVLQIPYIKNKNKLNHNGMNLPLFSNTKERITKRKNFLSALKRRLKALMITVKMFIRKKSPKTSNIFNYNDKILVEFKKEMKDKILNNPKNSDMKNIYEKKKITIKNLKDRIKTAQNFYQNKSFGYVVLECKKIIEELLDQIATQLNFKFYNISDFLIKIERNRLEKSFIIYSDLKKLSKIIELGNSSNKTSIEDANLILKHTKRIFLKLNHKKKNANEKNRKFSNAYDHYFNEIKSKIKSKDIINNESEDGNKKQNIPKYALLFLIFDDTKGPIQYLKISNLKLTEKLPSIIASSFYNDEESKMFVQEGFFICNKLFQIPSEWSKNFGERLLLSLIFKETEGAEWVNKEKIIDILNVAIDEIKNYKKIFKGLYFQKRSTYFSKLPVNQEEIIENYRVLKDIFIKLNSKIKRFLISSKEVIKKSSKREKEFQLLKKLIDDLLKTKNSNNFNNQKLIS